MKKIRYSLVVMALLATLGGFSVPVLGSMANAASSQHVSAAVTAGHTTGAVAVKRLGPCPVLGANDC